MKKITLGNSFKEFERHLAENRLCRIEFDSLLRDLCDDNSVSFIGQGWHANGIQYTEGTLRIAVEGIDELWELPENGNILALGTRVIERDGDTSYLDFKMEEKTDGSKIDRGKEFFLHDGQAYTPV